LWGPRWRERLLAHAACLLFPTWEEPFGLVQLEAMACGTPVVALRAGSVPEIVADGETGIVCDRAEELAEAVREIGRVDPARCRAHVAKGFTVEAMARGYERLYRRLLALGGRR
jgi:glycosyltransferase involved in cell wall biosynthesis